MRWPGGQQPGGGRLQGRESILRGNQPCRSPGLGPPASGTARKSVSPILATLSLVFCDGSWSKPMQWQIMEGLLHMNHRKVWCWLGGGGGGGAGLPSDLRQKKTTALNPILTACSFQYFYCISYNISLYKHIILRKTISSKDLKSRKYKNY